MGTKSLTVTEEAYERLAMRKKTNESFSDVIIRSFPKASFLELAGIFTKKEARAIEKNIKEGRRLSKRRHERLRW